MSYVTVKATKIIEENGGTVSEDGLTFPPAAELITSSDRGGWGNFSYTEYMLPDGRCVCWDSDEQEWQAAYPRNPESKKSNQEEKSMSNTSYYCGYCRCDPCQCDGHGNYTYEEESYYDVLNILEVEEDDPTYDDVYDYEEDDVDELIYESGEPVPETKERHVRIRPRSDKMAWRPRWSGDQLDQTFLSYE